MHRAKPIIGSDIVSGRYFATSAKHQYQQYFDGCADA